MEKRIVKSADYSLEYFLFRRQVKNINLRCKSDMTVSVSANDLVPIEVIDLYVLKKINWIKKNLFKYEQVSKLSNSSKEYVSGEEFKYLGKQLRLKVLESKEEKVILDADFLYLYVKNRDNYNRKRNLIEDFYKVKSYVIFNDCVTSICKQLNKEKPIVKIQHMISRWGSCLANKNTIMLNSFLIFAPQYCIEYVILHEMIHFDNPYHNKSFYTRLTAYCPDWKECKNVLNKIIIKEV